MFFSSRLTPLSFARTHTGVQLKKLLSIADVAVEKDSTCSQALGFKGVFPLSLFLFLHVCPLNTLNPLLSVEVLEKIIKGLHAPPGGDKGDLSKAACEELAVSLCATLKEVGFSIFSCLSYFQALLIHSG